MRAAIDVILGALAAAGLLTYLTGESYPRGVLIFLIVGVVFQALRAGYHQRQRSQGSSS